MTEIELSAKILTCSCNKSCLAMSQRKFHKNKTSQILFRAVFELKNNNKLESLLLSLRGGLIKCNIAFSISDDPALMFESPNSKTTYLRLLMMFIFFWRKNTPFLIVTQFLSSPEKLNFSEMGRFRTERFIWL